LFPLLHGKLLDRCGVLDAGVVDKYIDAAEAVTALLRHFDHLLGPRQAAEL
jgi:hypothetical protein